MREGYTYIAEPLHCTSTIEQTDFVEICHCLEFWPRVIFSYSKREMELLFFQIGHETEDSKERYRVINLMLYNAKRKV